MTTEPILTTCSRCGREVYWLADNTGRPLCWQCGAVKRLPPKEYARAYYEAHKAEIREQQRAYYESHKAEIAEQQRAYYESHKAEVAEQQRAYREIISNPDLACEVMDCWRPRVNDKTGLCFKHQADFERLLAERRKVPA